MKKKIISILNYFGFTLIKVESNKIYKAPSEYENFSFHPTPIGNYYLPKEIKNDIVAEKMKRGLFYDYEIIKLAKLYCKPETIVIDIGANLGQMSIEFSKLVGNDGFVYAFEAQKKVYDILLMNIKANYLKNIKTFYNAVFSTSGNKIFFPEIDLSKFTSLGSFGIDLQSKTGTEIESIALDSINFDKTISFMKIDIQGADLAALKGAINTIKKHKMPIIFEYEEQFQEQFGTSFQDYVDFVEEIDYKFLKTIDKINYLIVPK